MIKIKKITVQEWLPIEEIYNDGIVKLKNKKLIKIIKINPINYNLKSDLEKEAILNSYKIFLKTCNFDIQILIQSNKEDLSHHIKNIQKNISKKENKYLKKLSENYIEYINQINLKRKSSSKDFYIIISDEINDKKNYLQSEEIIRNDLKENVKFEYPEPHDYKPVLRDVLQNVPESVGAKYPEKKKKVFDLVPPGGYWRDLPDDVARDYMKSCYFMGGGRTGIARRISWDEPSLTLTCSPMMKQTDRCHPDESRPFTTREYARIQSFPDEWSFSGKMNDIYKQIGNAVPVELAKEVGISIMNALNKGVDVNVES